MDEKNVMESLELMQRILINILKGEKVPDNDFVKLQKINFSLSTFKKAEPSETDLNKIVTKYLNELGIPANVKGFNYLRCAIILKVKNSTIRITEIYWKVSEEFHTSFSKVERSIRYAIQLCWNQKLPTIKQIDLFKAHLSINCKPPTNGNFIFAIAEDIKIKA